MLQKWGTQEEDQPWEVGDGSWDGQQGVAAGTGGINMDKLLGNQDSV